MKIFVSFGCGTNKSSSASLIKSVPHAGKTDSTYSSHVGYMYSLLITLLFFLTPIQFEIAVSSIGLSVSALPEKGAHPVLYRLSLPLLARLT